MIVKLMIIMDILDKKISFGFFPTPIQYLDKLSEILNFEIYIKRDDNTGLATGGNKTRKLEYLIYDAIEKGADTIITTGAQQSNHCRQTAAACASIGMECHLILRGNEPEKFQGNLLLSKLLGAKIHYTKDNKKEVDFKPVINNLKSEGKRPYVIPYGGSNIIGALGFVNAVRELKKQLENMEKKMDYIFFASSSGGTQAGLTLGIEIFKMKSKLMPINIDKEETYGLKLEELVLKLVNQGKDLFKIKKRFTLKDTFVINNYNNNPYGVYTKNENNAINLLAKTQGILLDPVYTGRAFYGMVDYLKFLNPESNVLFWHTGGIPALFDYANQVKFS